MIAGVADRLETSNRSSVSQLLGGPLAAAEFESEMPETGCTEISHGAAFFKMLHEDLSGGVGDGSTEVGKGCRTGDLTEPGDQLDQTAARASQYYRQAAADCRDHHSSIGCLDRHAIVIRQTTDEVPLQVGQSDAIDDRNRYKSNRHSTDHMALDDALGLGLRLIGLGECALDRR